MGRCNPPTVKPEGTQQADDWEIGVIYFAEQVYLNARGGRGHRLRASSRPLVVAPHVLHPAGAVVAEASWRSEGGDAWVATEDFLSTATKEFLALWKKQTHKHENE